METRTSHAAALLLLLASSPAWAEPFKASLYEQGSQKSKLLFKVERTDRKEGDEILAHIVSQTPEGAVAVIEDARTVGPRFLRYSIDQKQLGESGAIEAHNGKLQFSYTREGKTESATEDLKENTIVGPTTVDYLHAHWAELLKGDDVSVRFASADRRETVGFKFFKISETDKALVVKMKPTSFIIAAIVNPLIFTFSKETRRLTELNGRAVPKRQLGGKWKDLDAEIVYQY